MLKCLFVFLFSVKNHPPKIPLPRRMKRDESLLAPNESHKFKRHNLAQNSWWRRRTKKRKKFRSFFFKQQLYHRARFFSLSLSLSLSVCVCVCLRICPRLCRGRRESAHARARAQLQGATGDGSWHLHPAQDTPTRTLRAPPVPRW